MFKQLNPTYKSCKTYTFPLEIVNGTERLFYSITKLSVVYYGRPWIKKISDTNYTTFSTEHTTWKVFIAENTLLQHLKK